MDVLKFEKWLTDRGAEILPVTNEHELIRFKGKEVGVIYKSGKTSNLYTTKTIKAYNSNSKWSGKPVNVGRNKSYKKEKIELLERDGSNCFLCGEPLNDDISLEHLIPLSAGGKNSLANMVLMHESCNHQVGNMPIHQKVKTAIDYRLLILSNNE